MKKPFISIIIPLYNAEKYIYKNISSILNQTFKDFELIIVNDSSTDKSLNIVKSFDNEKIKIYTKINEGTSNARNFGLKHANGKYIFFVDADDYIEVNTLQKYYEVVNEYNPDFITNGFYSETTKSNTSDKMSYPSRYYENKNLISKDLVNYYKESLLYNVWNKLFKKEIIDNNHLKFKDINFGEDMIFVQEYIKCCNSFYNIEDCLYHYVREVKNSITTSFIPNLLNIRIAENKILSNFFGNFGIKKSEYNDFIAKRYIERTLGCLENIHRKSYLSFRDKMNEVNNIIHCKETKNYLKIYRTNNKVIKIILFTYRFKKPYIAFFIGYCLYIFKSLNPSLFNSIKNKRG